MITSRDRLFYSPADRLAPLSLLFMAVLWGSTFFVLHDMLDISAGKKARFVRNFMLEQSSIAGAIGAYVAAVKNGSFPAAAHCY